MSLQDLDTGRLAIQCQDLGCPGADQLRQLIITSLAEQGFSTDAQRGFTIDAGKDHLRHLHKQAVCARIQKAREGLRTKEERLLLHFANGAEVDPSRISPKLIEVNADSEEELLFRYARLHWSIPASAGYGRRLRFLVVDQNNGKLIGLFGLGDPVFAIGPRDRWIDWRKSDRRTRLKYVMDIFLLGAVPPYNRLLCGKLVSLLATANEVREAFGRKYSGKSSLIAGIPGTGEIALLTTTSALGRSSIYNRLTFDNRPAFIGIGFTAGSGEFHFGNGLYDHVLAYARHHCKPRSKHATWGDGWRNRREVIRTVLGDLGLRRELVYHGIRRELFVVPVADNAREFLRGCEESLRPIDRPAESIIAWFSKRWLASRATRDESYRSFCRDSLRLWREDS